MPGYCLTYIYHDCFLLETEKAVMIFDYWKDPLSKGKGKDFPPMLDEFDRSKNIYVVVSHHHKDHFSRRIFLWNSLFPGIKYIISKDTYKAVKYMLQPEGTYKGHRPPAESVSVLSPGEYYQDNNLVIKAYGSTDIGNSYAIETDNFKFFHAGDLNAWLWLDESTPQEVAEARSSYEGIIKDIKNDFPRFDLVMFPVDSRLGREYWWGAKYFVNQILTDLFVPMHFELVISEEHKEQRRIDAAAFNLFARTDYGAYLQLGATRCRYLYH